MSTVFVKVLKKSLKKRSNQSAGREPLCEQNLLLKKIYQKSVKTSNILQTQLILPFFDLYSNQIRILADSCK